jgi:hypothetical protein
MKECQVAMIVLGGSHDLSAGVRRPLVATSK